MRWRFKSVSYVITARLTAAHQRPKHLEQTLRSSSLQTRAFVSIRRVPAHLHHTAKVGHSASNNCRPFYPRVSSLQTLHSTEPLWGRLRSTCTHKLTTGALSPWRRRTLFKASSPVWTRHVRRVVGPKVHVRVRGVYPYWSGFTCSTCCVLILWVRFVVCLSWLYFYRL